MIIEKNGRLYGYGKGLGTNYIEPGHVFTSGEEFETDWIFTSAKINRKNQKNEFVKKKEREEARIRNLKNSLIYKFVDIISILLVLCTILTFAINPVYSLIPTSIGFIILAIARYDYKNRLILVKEKMKNGG